MKFILPALAMIVLATVAFMVGCTASQLDNANASIGGKPLATTQPTTQAAAENLASTVTGDAAAVTAAAPFPWNLVSIALGAVSAGLGALAAVKTSAANTASAVIAAAAPGVAQLVQQATDNQTLATDVTNIAQVAPGVISLLKNPTASSAIQAAGVVVGASTPAATPAKS